MKTAWKPFDAGIVLASRLHVAGYQMYSRILDDDVIFRAEKHGERPNTNAGGYRHLDSACAGKIEMR